MAAYAGDGDATALGKWLAAHGAVIVGPGGFLPAGAFAIQAYPPFSFSYDDIKIICLAPEMNRGGDSIGPTEKGVRKDVWRLRPNGRVKFQVQFGEYGGSYVSHCHNTAHEDFAMLFRYQILGNAGTPQMQVTPTPLPSRDGVTFSTTPPEILPEGIPPGSTI